MGPTMYFQHALDWLKGWPSPTAVDFSAKISALVTSTRVYGGRVAHVNDSQQFEMGHSGGQMPMFLIQGLGDFDVTNASAAGALGWTAISPIGNMSALVAVGSYELQTTEFDQTSTYHASDPLHAPTEAQITGVDKSAAGLLYNARNWPGGSHAALAYGTDSICAVVSRGAGVNANRQNVLSFWPYFYPAPAGS
jgi:hypothetical protein